jgi:thymidylate synthase
MLIINDNFNAVYQELISHLVVHGTVSTTRKGDEITELHDQRFTVTKPWQCLAFCRDMSEEYLKKEFAFYISGSNKLEDAMACSKFWKNCTDDGKTINSNYGRLLFHDRNKRGVTQFEHAIACLVNNIQSKKAVMTIYDKENAYISNDNPCTMFLRARITNNQLYLTTYMRSSDIYFGLPYDVPFFIFVQYALLNRLKEYYPDLSIGTYSHISSSLHMYKRNQEKLMMARRRSTIQYPIEYAHFYSALVDKSIIDLTTALNPLTDSKPQKLSEPTELAKGHTWMRRAWDVTQWAECLKKHVGGVLTITENNVEMFLGAAHGGPAGKACTYCVRDDDTDKWYGDECPSVHAEMKLIAQALRQNIDFNKTTIYVTHGPCDACLKFCDYVGIKKVVYDLPYKTNYNHWPNIEVLSLEEHIAKQAQKS